ncbi:MAG: hypothetical protein A2017_06910 [Lentisphaerae bacterium GWF2_44_16]|nr:MAG: hypothetical protein A2017_06910 [Lentisphaerae bacterium GWF2_44_16]
MKSKLSESPFSKNRERPFVYAAFGKSAYENTRKALSLFDLSPVCGKRVLLKPNAGRVAPPGSGVVTDPQVVAAAIDAFREAGAAETAVGESPITGVNTMEAFEVSGIASVAASRNCPLIDMDELPSVETDVPEGKAINSLKVCAPVFDYDIVVSIPVMKTHMHTGVTLSVKNMKGCLWRRSKVLLHMLPPVKGNSEKPINIAIADVSGILRPHLSIIDGMTGMEGLGPSAGFPKALNTVIVSADAFAADAVACKLMGLDAENIDHLRLGAERGYGTINIDNIEIEPGNWKDFISPFEKPPENLSIQFPNINVLDKSSCSACQSTLLLFLKKYAGKLSDYFPKNEAVNIAIGKGHDDVPLNTLCVGNCTSKHKNKGIFVPGCPPVGSEILNVLSKSKTKE